MTQRPRIYLDHAATTPILPAAKAAMVEAMERWANPSSPHAEGRAARAALEHARERIKLALGWSGDLIFTSGATEAIEIALKRGRRGTRITSTVEHLSVLRAAPDALRVAVDKDGSLELDLLRTQLASADRPLVAIQTINSETGTGQDEEAIGAIVREAGGLWFADCSQSAGKWPLPDADFISVSAHKLGGPPGVGALLVRDLRHLSPVSGQERGYRPGTENLLAIAGFAAALDSGRRDAFGRPQWLFDLENQDMGVIDLFEAIVGEGGSAVPFYGRHSSLIFAFSMPGVSAQSQLIEFDLAGISVSAGSACSSGSLRPSHVMDALRVDPDVARCVIRVSFGWTTSREDLERFLDAWLTLFKRAGKHSG